MRMHLCFGCVDDELGVVSPLTDAASINYNRSGRKPVPSISGAPIVINLCVMGLDKQTLVCDRTNSGSLPHH